MPAIQVEQEAGASLWRVVSVATLGALLAQLDATVVNVSMSTLSTELDASLSTIQWVTSGYLLALAFALPLNSWLIQRIGVKSLYLWCFSIFTISSALCGLAWSAASLIGFRVLQGASGGLLAPMAQLVVKRAAGPHFTRIAGYASIPVLLGPALGPVIAGATLHFASWRWLFLINLPVGVLAIALAALFLPKDDAAQVSQRLDWLGLCLLSPSLVLLLFGADHLTQPAGLFTVIAGVVLIAAFLWIEKRKGHGALIDLDLFHRRVFSVASVIQFFWNGVIFAGQMLVPILLMQAYRLSPAMMGWMLAPLGLGMMIAVPSLGFLTSCFGERSVAVVGAFLSLAATLVLAWLANRGLDTAALATTLLVRGLSLGAIGLPVLSLAYESVDRDALPMATTAINIMQRIGGPTLTTLCALFLSWSLEGNSKLLGLNAWSQALFALTALHVIMAIAVVWLPRRHEV